MFILFLKKKLNIRANYKDIQSVNLSVEFLITPQICVVYKE